LWEEVRDAVSQVYRSTTVQDLLERDEHRLLSAALNYSI
jgi:DNA-binding IscR family transcriptional regulator